MWSALDSGMSNRRPIHPLLTALPCVAFAITIAALLAHAVTHDAVWYRAALYANGAGVIVALFAFTIGLVDAENQAAGSQAREAGMRHIGFEAVALFEELARPSFSPRLAPSSVPARK